MRYELIEYKVWQHPVTGTRASIYGSHPDGYELTVVGWTFRDTERGTVGNHRIRPGMTREQVQAVVDSLNR